MIKIRDWFNSFLKLYRQLGRLWPHCGVRFRLVAAVIAGMFLMTILEGFGVGMLIPLLSLLLGGENATPMRPLGWLEGHFPGRSSLFYIGALATAIVVAITFKNLASYATSVITARMKRLLMQNLREHLFENLHQSSLDHFESQSSSRLNTLFMSEVVRMSNAFETLLALVQRTGMACLYFGVLFYIHWKLTGMVVVFAVVLTFSLRALYRRLGFLGEKLSEQNRALAMRLSELFGGVRVVRSSNAQKGESQRFLEVNSSQAYYEEQASRAHALLLPSVETLAVLGGMLIIVMAYSWFVQPGLMLSSHLLGFGFILLRVLPLLQQIYGLHGHLRYGVGAFNEVEYWLGVEHYPRRPFGTKHFESLQDRLLVREVGYSYQGRQPALTSVSFEVRLGQTVALVGSSGAGKSTLASLLLRLREPSQGAILLDGVDYWEFSSASWHRTVALVEQEAFLFHDTLANNIAFGLTGVSETEITDALRVANLHEILETLPQGLQTIVGERGTKLSGGQRQRLAIARAVVRQPKVLVLDEATSHLDTVTEQLVQQALTQAMQGRTTLVIAHRLSTIRHADWIVVFNQGKVEDQGTWEQLSQRKGLFARMAITG